MILEILFLTFNFQFLTFNQKLQKINTKELFKYLPQVSERIYFNYQRFILFNHLSSFSTETMFTSNLQKIIKRQNYIDQLSNQQISTIQTKQLFFKALQQSPHIDPINDNDQFQHKIFTSPNIDGPATNLLKHILPAQQNSYEEIQQIQNRMKLFNDKKLNQVELVKLMFEQDKEQIKTSGLKVSDFLELYQSEDMQQQDKDINDPLIKKIMAYFQTNTKQYSIYDLLCIILESVGQNEAVVEQEQPQIKAIRRLRQSVCSIQGFNINIEDDQSQFNQQTKREMDKILEYYKSIIQIFNIQNQE